MFKKKQNFWFSAALIYLGFFALIAIAMYITQSAVPLWALLLAPSFSYDDVNDEEEETEDEEKE